MSSKKIIVNNAFAQLGPVDDTVQSGSNYAVSGNAVSAALAGKQSLLVSGVNVKTINGVSLLGFGNLSIAGGDVITSAAQTLTNKTLRGDQNTFSNIPQSAITNLATDLAGINTALAGKQTALVSGTSIKTINGVSVLGSGDLALQSLLVSGTSIKTVNGVSLLGSGDIAIPGEVTLAGAQTLTNKALSGSSNTFSNIPQSAITNLTTDLAGKQASLISGVNLKTVNGTSLLGSGNIVIQGASGDVTLNGSQTLTNKTLSGTANTFQDIPATSILASDIEDIIIDATPTSGSQGFVRSGGIKAAIDAIAGSIPVAVNTLLPLNSTYFPFGDRQTSIGYSGSGTNIQYQNFGYAAWALFRSGGFYIPKGAFSENGYSEFTSEMVARAGKIAAYQPKVVSVLAGLIDLMFSQPLSAIKANLRQLYDIFLSMGARVIAITVPPRFTSGLLSNSDEANRLLVNEWIKSQTDVMVVDCENALGGPQYFDTDGIDFSALGAYTLGELVAVKMRPLITPANLGSIIAPDTSIARNPSMNGSSGGKETGATGSVADLWQLSGPGGAGGATITGSKETDASGREAQVFTLGGNYSGNFQKARIYDNSTSPDPARIPAVNTLFEGMADIEIVQEFSGAVEGISFEINLYEGNYGTLLLSAKSMYQTSATPLNMPVGRYLLRTPPLTMPAGIVGTVDVALVIYLKNSVSSQPCTGQLKAYTMGTRPIPTEAESVDKRMIKQIGPLSNLTTSTKASVVAAMNELKTLIASGGGSVVIDSVPTNGSPNAVSSDGVFDALATKQATLVSGTTLKTINGTSLLGSGDIVVSGGGGTIDSVPTNGSSNAVSSDGVFDALALKQDKLPAISGATSGKILGNNGSVLQWVDDQLGSGSGALPAQSASTKRKFLMSNGTNGQWDCPLDAIPSRLFAVGDADPAILNSGTDDTAALNTWAASGNFLYLEKGYYKVTDKIVFSNRANIKIIAHPEAYLVRATTFPQTASDGSGSRAILDFRTVDGLHVEGVKIMDSGQNVNIPGPSCVLTQHLDSIYVKTCNNVTLKDVLVTYPPKAGFRMFNNTNVMIQNCRVLKATGFAFEINSNTNVQVMASQFTGRGLEHATAGTPTGTSTTNPFGINLLGLFTQCDKVFCAYNIFHDSYDTNTKTEGCNYVTYHGNEVTNSGKDGLKVMGYNTVGAKNITISDNTVEYLYDYHPQGSGLIVCDDADGFTVTGNTVRGGLKMTTNGHPEHGISVSRFTTTFTPKNGVVSNNSIYSPTYCGINMQGVLNVTVAGNTIVEYATAAQANSNGIYVAPDSSFNNVGVHILNNIVARAAIPASGTDFGIYVRKAVNCSANGNTVIYPKQSGIAFDTVNCDFIEASDNRLMTWDAANSRASAYAAVLVRGYSAGQSVSLVKTHGNLILSGHAGVEISTVSFSTNTLSVGLWSVQHNIVKALGPVYKMVFRTMGASNAVTKLFSTNNVTADSNTVLYDFTGGLTPTVWQTGEFEYRGNGSPETVVSAPISSRYQRLDAAPVFYVKETGSSSTGWKVVQTNLP